MEITLQNLETNSIESEYFSEEVINNLISVCEKQICALPSSARLRKIFNFKMFEEVYIPFAAAIKEKVKNAFSGISFWGCFTIFDL